MGHNSADYIHTSVEAVKLAMADRDKYLGDTDFVRVPYRGLLSETYAEERRKLIDPKECLARVPARSRREAHAGFDPIERPGDVDLTGDGDHEGDTSYIAAVDQAAQRDLLYSQPAQRASAPKW